MTVEKQTKRDVDALRDDFARMRADLERLRDTIRVRIHLGSMELRERFEALEPRVDELEKRAEKATTDVGKELRQSWSHVKKALERIRDELDRSTH